MIGLNKRDIKKALKAGGAGGGVRAGVLAAHRVKARRAALAAAATGPARANVVFGFPDSFSGLPAGERGGQLVLAGAFAGEWGGFAGGVCAVGGRGQRVVPKR